MAHPWTKAAAFEHRFWLQVLGDHARFIHDSLAPKEQQEIRTAAYFIRTFDELLTAARRELEGNEWSELTAKAHKTAASLREFKLYILKEHLSGMIHTSLPPTFYNHMVNELDEYMRILHYLGSEQTPPSMHPVHHHLLWLQDAFGHAASIKSNLDPIEKQLIRKSDEYQKTFEAFYLKAVEMAGYLRTRLHEFPALSRFNEQVSLEMALFHSFLEELEEMDINKTVLDVFAPLLADHMAREECYYLTKLAESSNTKKPGCDPTKPRTTTP